MEELKDWDNGGQAPVSFGPNNRQGVTKVVVLQGIKGGPDGIGRWNIAKTWTEPRKR